MATPPVIMIGGTTPTLLAMATTLAATNTLFAMDGTGDVCEFVEFHKGFLKKRPALLEKGGGTRI